MRKRVLTAFFVMLIAVLMLTPAFAIVEPTDSFYVADYANVLSSDTEQEIIEANGVLENTCDGAQFVVVAVEYLDGLYSDEYALQVMNDWGVGDAYENNGMVLVFATKENKGWLMTGDGIDGYFTDSMAEDYLNRYFWDSFDKGQYDKAVQKLLPELTKWYKNYYGAGSYYHNQPYQKTFWDYFDSRLVTIILLVVLLTCSKYFESRRQYRRYYSYRGVSIPPFRIYHMWSGPHIDWNDPSVADYDRYGGNSRSGGNRSGRSGGFRSSGRGGGGRGGGGGGGRR